MLPRQFWRRLEGMALDGRVRVGQLLRAEREGLFAAEMEGFEGDCELTVRFIRATSEPVLERYLEASFLSHPNLLRCFLAGKFEFSGTPFIYAVMERADTTLADVRHERLLNGGEAAALGLQLVEALRYLHDRDLAYCNLDPANVVLRGDRWALAEYSQLRLAGNGYATETRRMLALSPGTPPEAWDGIVSCAWDTWALGWLLAGVISERGVAARGSRTATRRELPQPFAAIISACLNPSPSDRCSLDRVAQLLSSPVAPAATEAPEAARMAPGTAPEPQPVTRAKELASAAGIGARPRQLRIRIQPRQAVLTALGFTAAFVVLTTLIWHPRQAEVAAAPRVAPNTPPVIVVANAPVQHAAGEADRAVSQAADSPHALLERWASSLKKRDVDEQVSCYAPTVYAFYGAHDVTPEAIRERRVAAMARYTDIRRLDISGLQIQMKTPMTAVATFDETWDFRGGAHSSGKVQERLGMRKTAEGWRITSESNIRTYRRSGQMPQS